MIILDKSSKEIFHSIVKNSLYYYLAEIVARFAMLLLYIVIARKLGAEGFGEISFNLVIVSLVLLTCDFGYSQIAIKNIPLFPNHEETLEYLSKILSAKYISAMILVMIFILYSSLNNFSITRILFFLIYTLSQIALFFPLLIGIYFRATNNTKIESLLRIIISFTTSIAGLVFVLIFKMGIIGFAISALIASIITCSVAYYITLKKGIRFNFIKRLNNIDVAKYYFEIIKPALPFGILALVGTISYRIDTVMLALIKGSSLTGIYSAGVKILDIGLLIPGSMAAVAFAPLSLAIRRNELRVAKNIYETLLKYMLILGGIIALGISLNSSIIVRLIYSNQEYRETVPVLEILIWAIIPIYLTGVTATIISASVKPSINAVLALVMVLFNISINIYFINNYGAIGAAITTVLTETLGLGLGLLYIRKSNLRFESRNLLFKGVVALGISGLIAFVLRDSIIKNFSIVVFIALMYMMKIFNWNDFTFLKFEKAK